MSGSALIDVRLPDGSSKQITEGSNALDVAAAIGSRLAKAAVAAVVNDHEADLTQPLANGDRVSIITADSDAGRHVLRHSTAHVLAQAVLQLFPGAKFTIGPAIEDGFYYDFDLPGGRTFTD
ncbi:MAG: TGS domain-containing protein, partial [Actinomycetota bacterium]